MLTDAFEIDVRRWGHRLAARLPDGGRNPAAAAERRMMQAVIGDARLRAALFRFVDVRPACRNRADLVRHLNEYLAEAARESGTAQRLSSLGGAARSSFPRQRRLPWAYPQCRTGSSPARMRPPPAAS